MSEDKQETSIVKATDTAIPKKVCTICKENKPRTEFHLRRERRDGLGVQSVCKQCTKYERRKYIKKYPERIRKSNEKWAAKPGNKERKRLLTERFKIRRKQEWKEIFINRGLNRCSKCGYDKSLCAIDLHHVDPKQKEIPIAMLTKYKPNEDRIKELDKCIPLCANCHRELHLGGK